MVSDHCISQTGLAKSIRLQTTSEKLFLLASPRKILLSAGHVPGVENVWADALSRSATSSAEWSPMEDASEDLVDLFGMPEVDLYAPSENQRPPQYNTRTSVTQAGGPNALRSDWNKRSYFNLFPPPTPSGSTEVCSRLWPFRGQVPLVAPRRKAQPWHATQLRGWPEPSPRNHLALVGCGLHQSGMSAASGGVASSTAAAASASPYGGCSTAA